MITSLVEILRLDEVRGRIRDLDDILDSFKAALERRMQPVSKCPFTITLTGSDLKPIQAFANNVQVELRVRRGFYTKATGEFVTQDLKLASNKKLDNIHIALEIDWDPRDDLSELTEKATSDFSHEITHAYEEYERLVRKAPSLGAKDYLSRYSKFHEEAYSLPEYVVRSILYFTNKVEQKAFIGELYGECQRLVPKCKSASELYEMVFGKLKEKPDSESEKFSFEIKPKTQVGLSYRNCEQLMRLWNRKEKWQGEYIQDFANENTPGWQEELIHVWNDIFGIKVETIGDITIKLNRIWEKYNSTFKTKTGKVIYDVWKEKAKH